MRFVLYTFFFAVLLGCCGCRSKDAAAVEARQVETPKKAAPEHRSPTDILPFKAKQTPPPPSLYDSTLSPRERELMRTFRSDGEIKITEPGQGQDAKASRKWVFGY